MGKVSLLICLLLTGCDFLGSGSDSKKSDVFSAEFELTEVVPVLQKCEGTRNIPYVISKCLKNGVEAPLTECSHLIKADLVVKSPAGTKTFAIEGDENNFVGDKTYNCSEGEGLLEEKVSVSCSDSRYLPYALGDNPVNNTCKPYPVYLHDGLTRIEGYYKYITVLTDSIGDVYELNFTGLAESGDLASIKKVTFPKTNYATAGAGGICGFKNDKVFCEIRNDGGSSVLRVDEISDLSRNVNILKIEHADNLLCALYEDNEVACTQAPRFLGSIGTNRVRGGAGRGIETNEGNEGTKKQLIFEKDPLIEEYQGAINISAAQYISCALFSDKTVKCSGQLGDLTQEEYFPGTPIEVLNKNGSRNTSYLSSCPFPKETTSNCVLNYNKIGEDRVLYYSGSLVVTERNLIYKYNEQSPYSFSLYHNMSIDVTHSTGHSFISNKRLYFNQSIPRLIKVY